MQLKSRYNLTLSLKKIYFHNSNQTALKLKYLSHKKINHYYFFILQMTNLALYQSNNFIMKLLSFFFLFTFSIILKGQNNDIFTTTVTFPANYAVGDYVEFLQVAPLAAGSSGYYEISIAYTRGGVAASATHIASASHASPNVWREAGRVNNNVYVNGNNNYNFTIDINPSNHKLRVRAVNTMGVSAVIPVIIKVRSINSHASFSSLNITGNSQELLPYAPMSNDWDLIVGNLYSGANGKQAIKVLPTGFVGINTRNPAYNLDVNGKIRAQEIKVEAGTWPDYVFIKDYKLKPLGELKDFIIKNNHLPNIPSAIEVEKNGVDLGEMNRKLLEKIEELTLYIIDQGEEIKNMKEEIDSLKKNKD